MQIVMWMAVMVGALALMPGFAAGESLKETYAGDFPVGVALGGEVTKAYSAAEVKLIEAQFNAVTPENCMKPEPVHPEEGTWHFAAADALVDFAVKNHMAIFGHTLVWHNQTPEWFFKDGEKAATRELALDRMKKHIGVLVGRYKGKLRGWDVVNEAISDKDDEYLRKCPWLGTVGEDYVEKAFEFAHAADPAAELQYNDYGIEMPVKRKKVLRLLKELKAKGIVVASVGIQGHWQLDHVPYEELEKSIEEFREAGVKVAITELDLDVLPREATGADATAKEAESKALQEVKPCPPEVLQRQAEQYGKLFAMFKRHKADLVRVTFWGLDDAHTWLTGWPVKRYNHPLLWDRQGAEKPAYRAVLDAAR